MIRYEAEFLNTGDVCSNCFGLRRLTTDGSQWRNREIPTVDYGPAKAVSN